MADQFGLFWNSINADRTYDADSFAEWLRKFFTTGVFNGEMQVTPGAGMAVSVSPGYANLNGKVRFFDAAQSFTLDPASGTYPRIDTIVVRSDSTNRVITTEYVKGAYSGNNPVPTAPVRTAGIYEIVLAQIYVGAGITAIIADDITDTRPDDDLCGWVTSTVEGVPVDQIVTQMQAQFLTWFDEMKGQLSEDAAGHLQNQITNLRDSITFSGTSPATSPIYKNNYFYYSPDETHMYLCKAIANIAVGDTLVSGTNYEVVTGNYIIGDINNRIGDTDISDIGNSVTKAISVNNDNITSLNDNLTSLETEVNNLVTNGSATGSNYSIVWYKIKKIVVATGEITYTGTNDVPVGLPSPARQFCFVARSQSTGDQLGLSLVTGAAISFYKSSGTPVQNTKYTFSFSYITA